MITGGSAAEYADGECAGEDFGGGLTMLVADARALFELTWRAQRGSRCATTCDIDLEQA